MEDASGKLIQKEFAGTESKSETEKLLRAAMDDYDSKKFVACAENITLGELLDNWVEDDLKTGSLANGTVQLYLQTVKRIKQHPISKRRLSTITADHLQAFMDLLAFGGTEGYFHARSDYNRDYPKSYNSVLSKAFRYAVFLKRYITYNPMQYVVMKKQKADADLFVSDDEFDESGGSLSDCTQKCRIQSAKAYG